MICKCGATTSQSSGGSIGKVYCNRSAMLVDICDGENRLDY